MALCIINGNYGVMGLNVTESTEENKRYTSRDIVATLQNLRRYVGENQKLAIFCNNASIHRAKIVQTKAK